MRLDPHPRPDALTDLGALVSRIREAEGTVVDVARLRGAALRVIADDRMWVGHAPTFLRFCQDHLELTGDKVRHLLAVATVDAELAEAGLSSPRRLVDYTALWRLPPGRRAEVWAAGRTALPVPAQPNVALLAAQVRLARACARLAPWIGADAALEPALLLALHHPDRRPLAAAAEDLLRST